MKCKQHPKYRGIYKHRTECETCDHIYFENHGQLEQPIPKLTDPEPVFRNGWFKRLLTFGR
jgi:hypothetical protein